MVIEITVTGIDEAVEYLDRLDSRAIPALDHALRNMANEIAIRINRLAKMTHARIYPKKEGELAYIVGTNQKYVEYQNEGTGIYGYKGDYIRPKKGRFLRWMGKSFGPYRRLKGITRTTKGKVYISNEVFAKKVKGVRGRHFVEQAIDDYYSIDAAERAAKDMEYMGIGEVE